MKSKGMEYFVKETEPKEERKEKTQSKMVQSSLHEK